MELVSWDDDIPNMWKVMKFMFQSTNQNLYDQNFILIYINDIIMSS